MTVFPVNKGKNFHRIKPKVSCQLRARVRAKLFANASISLVGHRAVILTLSCYNYQGGGFSLPLHFAAVESLGASENNRVYIVTIISSSFSPI